ncbi:MAG: class I SAM-dependent methyltransferase [Lachnospiraceae bacterium]|nr:class I SAM-dependent methyltransferase [Lachnospiraceae bacterium]
MPLISKRFANDGEPILELSELQKKYISIFNEKCRSGEYKFRKRSCECGSDDLDVIAQKDRYGIPMDTVICRNCGLIMTNPLLDDKSNNAFYDNEYPFIYRAEEVPSEEMFLDGKKNAEFIISFIRKHDGKESGSVLEIGCADGRNVAAFAEAGYDACGIDLSHRYVEFGKGKGLNLFCTDAASFEKEGKKFDIIVLNHVLEHFTDIGREINIIDRMLNPEGCLFISVPGVKALTFGTYAADFLRLLQNAHIYNFTKTSLCSVMGRYGFECIFANEMISSVFRKGSPTDQKNDSYDDIMKYFRRLEEAGGNLRILLISRAVEKISSYNKGEVLLYGTAKELDAIVQGVSDVSSIMGFFYSDIKSPKEVVDYIMRLGKKPKCLVVADIRQNNNIFAGLSELIKGKEVELFSVYSEQF